MSTDPRDIDEIAGRLDALRILAWSIESEANDAWCEGTELSTEQIAWLQGVYKFARALQEQIIAMKAKP